MSEESALLHKLLKQQEAKEKAMSEEIERLLALGTQPPAQQEATETARSEEIDKLLKQHEAKEKAMLEERARLLKQQEDAMQHPNTLALTLIIASSPDPDLILRMRCKPESMLRRIRCSNR